MPTTCKLIAKVTVGSGGASNIEFTSIPGTYTDLWLVVTARNASSSGGALELTFNGSGSSYSSRYLQGNGASASSATYTTSTILAGDMNVSTTTASTFSSVSVSIPNYAGSTNKSVSAESVEERNGTTAYITAIAGLWSNTAAITSVKVAPNLNTFAQHSSAFLYGITKA